MADRTFCEIDVVVYFTRHGDAPDMRRLVHTLRCDMARSGKPLQLRKHVPGRFLEFACEAGHGSVVFAPVPIAEELRDLQAEGAAYEARAALADHQAHLHIRLTTEQGCPSGAMAARRLLRSALGTMQALAPSAIWYSPQARLMTPEETVALDARTAGADAPAPAVASDPAAEVFRTATAAAHLIHGRGRTDVRHVMPRRVTLPHGKARGVRPVAAETMAAQAHPSRISRYDNLFLNLPGLPFGVSYGSMGRVAAGMVAGVVLTSAVQAGLGATGTTLTATESGSVIQAAVQPPEAERMCGSKRQPIPCPQASE